MSPDERSVITRPGPDEVDRKIPAGVASFINCLKVHPIISNNDRLGVIYCIVLLKTVGLCLVLRIKCIRYICLSILEVVGKKCS